MREKLPVKIKLGEKEYDLNYEEELKCAEETINENLVDQPSLFAWYAVLQEMAEDVYSHAKMEFEISEAHLDAQYRKEAADKEEKIMEKQILSKIVLNDTHIALRNAMMTARKNVGILKAIKESFAHRKDMLISLASNLRAQMDPDIFVKKEQAKQKL